MAVIKLECSCQDDHLSRAADGAATLDADLTVIYKLSQMIMGEGSLKSPEEHLTRTPLYDILSVEGSGPYYNITLGGDIAVFNNESGEYQFVEIGNTGLIEHDGESYEYEVTNINDNILTIFYTGGTNGDADITTLCEVIDSEYEGYDGYDGYDVGTCYPQISFLYQNDNPFITYSYASETSITAIGDVQSNLSADLSLSHDYNVEGDIFDRIGKEIHQEQEFISDSEIDATLDKFIGDFTFFDCLSKLYPTGDVSISSFINSDTTTSNLYSYINEGVFAGDYRTTGYLLSDDVGGYIQPSAVDAEGRFSYKAYVNPPMVVPDDSRLRMRISAPYENQESWSINYLISGVKFRDPNGKLIVEYEPVEIKGDGHKDSDLHYTTLSLAPLVENYKLHPEWSAEYPSFELDDQYTVEFEIIAFDLGEVFDEGFTFGYQKNPDIEEEDIIGVMNSMRVSALEICMSGSVIVKQQPLNLKIFNEQRSHKIERCIKPSNFGVYNFDDGVYPTVSSIWSTSDGTPANLTSLASRALIESLNDNRGSTYAQLQSMGPLADSGKLILEFSHTSQDSYKEITPGAFSFGFDQNQTTGNMWFSPSGSFNTLNDSGISVVDNFFKPETVTLKILAKKQQNSRDYILDVVGYSDDCIINVTSPSTSFLQNSSGVFLSNPDTDVVTFYGDGGQTPVFSGYASVDDLGIASEAISDRDQYYETNENANHRLLSTYPVIDSTEYRWYEIPLQIYPDEVTLGKSKNYFTSSLFEKLYLDIFPLPSGASIGAVELCVRYSPNGGLSLITEGGEYIKAQDGRSFNSFYPISRQSSDNYLNAGSGYNSLSTINGIPQGYCSSDSLKTNYSRRWRGMKGLSYGPFNINEFGFSFSSPLLDTPLIDCFMNFETLDNYTFTSKDLGVVDPVESNFTSDGSLTAPEKYSNIGLRFSGGSMFDTILPGYSSSHITADWTALSNGGSNFTNNELYGQIFDGYENVVRFGIKDNLEFTNVDCSSGIVLYARFIPDANVTGQNFNFYDRSVIFSLKDTPSSTQVLEIGFTGGYLYAKADDDNGQIEIVTDTLQYDQYQYPLSVLVTYDDNHDRKIRLYTDNELSEGAFTNLRGTSNSINLPDTSNNLYFGYSKASLSGLPMLACELGFSEPFTGSGCNVVESVFDRNLKQITATEFFDNQRAKFFNPGEPVENDTYKLWDYVDENTYSDWSLGSFRYCPFNYEFASLGSTVGKRTGRDSINFSLNHHGSGYSQITDISLPSSINSSVSYHTQIENDFLRFNLSDTESNFRSIATRVSKSLPRGYSFKERALVVETVMEHNSVSNNIVWEDGNIGPKLIVSLYTPTKTPNCEDGCGDRSNYGLVNRHIHYLAPSSCMFKADSVFDYNSLCDETEEWSLFARERKLSEFDEEYISTDVDQMFVQYDLSYPSGSPFDSRIDIHSVHVRAEDAWVTPINNSGSLNLISSGNYARSERLNFFTFGIIGSDSGSMPLVMSDLFTDVSGSMPLYTFGAFVNNDSLPLAIDFIGSGNTSVDLVTLGDDITWEDLLPNETALKSVSLNIFGHLEAENDFPLSVFNAETNLEDQDSIPLSMFASNMARSGIRDFLTFNLLGADTESGNNDDVVMSIVPVTQDQATLFSTYLRRSMPLVIKTPDILERNADGWAVISNHDGGLKVPSLPLVIPYNETVSENFDSGNMTLSVYNLGEGTSFIKWNSENYGQDINLIDESGGIPSLPPEDEIRGVDLIGYGSCDGSSPRKAIDDPIVTDNFTWREEVCNEGGISRAVDTYTNTDIGYSGSYYGIRKYTDLIGNSAYNAVMRITTGSTNPIPVPRDWEYWNYGICGPDWYADGSGCCNEDCDQNINYSGNKMIADYPYLSGDQTITDPSGRLEGDRYGTSVSVKEDLMAIGSPYHDVRDEVGQLVNNAGSIFLYRRGEDVPGKKAPWTLEDQLTLPSGYIRDYPKQRNSILTYLNDDGTTFSISGQKWYIGQEGRQLGYSLDITKSGEREIVVAGAPGAEWSRTFPDIEVSGIPVFMMVFTDKFTYNSNDAKKIGATASKFDILYKYFSQPWVFNDGSFNPELDIQLLICQIYSSGEELKTPYIREPWLHHLYINNLQEPNVDKEDVFNYNYSGILNKFNSIFPYNDNIYSGIPPILGVFGDDTLSTTNGLAYQRYVDNFIDFYENYTFASGVEDLQTSLPATGFVNEIYSNSFEWDDASVELLNKTLATGYLQQNDVLKLITSGIGQEYAQKDAGEFQLPPESGGRAYIFEKEFGRFNFVQELISPDAEIFRDDQDENSDLRYDTELLPSDRYGHSVAISKNGEVISVGSPYSAEACQVYERDPSETERMYEGLSGWLDFRNLSSEKSRYDQLFVDSGFDVASQTVYSELSQSNKFLLRTDDSYWGFNNGIKPYKKIFKYHHSDIDYIGTWSFLPDEFAGTSRLGFSTSISDDGDIVAFGAPTDSFNEFDDINVWGEGEQSWASYVNAGAVRIFESRKYFDHNKAVEFYKFGNIDRSINEDNKELEGEYDKLADIFASGQNPVPFERTEFANIEIPKDAGLAFIITPHIDAASDEVIDNIKSWLSLGDRTLVLVGNDPEWQNNGAYKQSNELINKILKKLGSRMRITAARNNYESLPYAPSEEDFVNNKFNITRAHLPTNSREDDTVSSHETYIPQIEMFGQNVADIKIDLSDLGLEDLLIYGPCNEKNPICSLPIKHSGDIRAEWHSDCVSKIEFNTNWPFHFDNPNPAQGCDFYPEIVKPEIRREYEDIRPILTAAEYIEREPLVIPADSGCDFVGYEYTLSGQICTKIGNQFTSYKFASQQEDELSFGVSQQDDIEEYLTIDRNGAYFDPLSFDGRNSLIQGRGKTKGETVILSREIAPESPFVISETYFNLGVETTSDVVIMAGLQSETKWSLGKESGQEYRTGNSDQNIAFYNNLVITSCSSPSASKIVQLGGWTQRTSFKDAYEGSFLDNFFTEYGHELLTNQVYINGDAIDSDVDVVWISNADQVPSTLDIQVLKEWLALGSKRLVVTYDSNKRRAGIAESIMSGLGLNSKPYQIAGINPGYAVQITDSIRASNEASIPFTSDYEPQIVSKDNPIISGCDAGYSYPNSIGSSTKVDKLAIIPTGACPPEGYCTPYSLQEVDYDEIDYTDTYKYIPISGGANSQSIITIPDKIFERYEQSSEYWQLIGDSNVSFSVEAGSGYRIFIDWVSEHDSEKYEIYTDFGDASFTADPEGYGQPEEDGVFGKTVKNIPNQYVADIRIPQDISVLNLSFNTYEGRINQSELDGNSPFTPRILSISGCLLPIIKTVTTATKEECKNVYYPPVPVYDCWETPEYTITYDPEFRPISTYHGQYCDPDNTGCLNTDPNIVIEDGPVVAAEELEHFTNFTQGANRSRIVLMTDSSMIQGKNPHFRQEGGPNVEFIRSLYPPTPSEVINRSDEFLSSIDGRNFSFTQKLRSPESSSPAKYFAVSGLPGLVDRFGYAGVAGNLDNYTDQEDKFNPADVFRRFTPVTKREIDTEIELFGTNVVGEYGIFTRFSGIFTPVNSDDPVYVDAGWQGGFSRFHKENGYDYLDFRSNAMDSGFLGDMFGWSVSLDNNQLLIGTPFNATIDKDVVSWSGIKDLVDAGFPESGYLLSNNGGPGSAFYYQRTGRGINAVSEFLPWEFVQKIKPDDLYAGLDNATAQYLTEQRGSHNLPDSFVEEWADRTDMFGFSVSVASDFMAVGAPGHDFGTFHEEVFSGVVTENGLSTAFVRKSFTEDFDVPKHNTYDLANSGIRVDQFADQSGKMVLNNGAIFTFRNNVTNWGDNTKEWKFAEKLVSQGYSDRNENEAATSGTENDSLGYSVSINRAFRGDSDYVLVGGAPYHNFATSGNHITGESGNAGAAYTWDAMLREQADAIPLEGGYIDAQVFGTKPEKELMLRDVVYQPTTGPQVSYETQGVVVADVNGNIFLEVSGFDPSTRGFVAHRPYVEFIIGELLPSDRYQERLLMNIGGRGYRVDNAWPELVGSLESGYPTPGYNAPYLGPNYRPSGMSLYVSGPDNDNVYNNMNLLSFGTYVDSGTLSMFTAAPSSYISDSMLLTMPSATPLIDELNLRVRGK